MNESESTLSAAEVVDDERRARLRDFPPCNVMVVGKTGVGKSYLLNAVFGADLAATGTGRPVTKHLKRHTLEDVPVGIVDSRGLELKDSLDAVVAELNGYIDDHAKDEATRVDVLWFCSSAFDTRLEEFEEKLLEGLAGSAGRTKAIAVLTQYIEGPRGRERVDDLKGRDLAIEAVVPVMAKELEMGIVHPSRGLDDLLEATRSVLPEAKKRSFDNAQRIDLEHKVAAARVKLEEYVLGVPSRPDLFRLLTGAHQPREADDVALRVLRMIGAIAACFGETALPRETVDRAVKQVFGENSIAGIAREILRWMSHFGIVISFLGGSAGAILGRLAARKWIGPVATKAAESIAAYVEAEKLRQAEQHVTRIVGEASIETFTAAAERGIAGKPMSDEELGRTFEETVERMLA